MFIQVSYENLVSVLPAGSKLANSTGIIFLTWNLLGSLLVFAFADEEN